VTLIFGVAAFVVTLSAGAAEQSAPPLPSEDLVQAAEPVDAATVETIPATAPDVPATAPQPASELPAEPQPVPDPAPPEQASSAGGEAVPLAEPPAVDPAPTIVVTTAQEARPKPARRARAKAKARSSRRPLAEPPPQPRPQQLGSELEPEVAKPGVDATIWLHRSLPDPTPHSKRLSRSFAGSLRAVARASRVDWALMLGLLLAEGRTGAAPAGAAELRLLASRLDSLRGEDEGNVALALAGNEERADRAVALAHYHRAVGLRALVRGLEWAKPRLEARLLRDDRIATYDGGRHDIQSGHVDVRVLTLIAYLADTYGEVTVSSLKTGHRLYARPGVISAHVYGLAVDISALGGIPIAGNQEPGGLTEDAARNILLLPSELQPRQVISLLGLGGPSFPMGDHGDHIHVGY
jgi:hypothetical protein